jgi:hypothetical protein
MRIKMNNLAFKNMNKKLTQKKILMIKTKNQLILSL